MISPNRFASRCNNPICRKTFAVNEGFCQKTDKGFKLWCRDCVPERVGAVAVATGERLLTADFLVVTPFEPDNLPLVRSLPGARFDGVYEGRKCWSCSRLEGDRVRVLELADRLGLTVAPQLRVVAMSAQADLARKAGVYQYQIEGVDFLSKRQKALLGDQMGLGKTLQALFSLGEGARSLAVVPASLKYNWMDEIKLWRPDLRSCVIDGKANFRWPEAGEIVIINREILPEFLTPVKTASDKYGKAVWSDADKKSAAETIVIVDEAHKFKNHKAACSKKMGQLTRAAMKVIGLTGTPLTNEPGDLFGVLSSLGMVGEVFGNWERFKSLFNANQGRFGTIWGRPSTEVPERLRRVMLSRTREEVLPNLPRKQYVTLTVENGKAVQKMLDALEVEYGSAVQVTGQLPPFTAFSKVRAAIAKDRIGAMMEFVESCEEQNEPLVVFCDHLSPMDALLLREGWAVITGDTGLEQRQEIVRAFQAGRLKGVGLTITAGGVGLTLTHANKMLFVDMNWVPANNWQAEDRICRIGQTADKVTIYRIVGNHPLDQHINRLLTEKIGMIEGAINAKAQAFLPKVNAGGTSGGVASETEEQFAERMGKLSDALADFDRKQVEESKEMAKAKIGGMLSREQARAGAEGKGRKLRPLTPDRVQSVREAFTFMLGVCDGAVERDGAGFNKPDAMVGHYVLKTDLETLEEVETAYWILTRYKSQLGKNYPLLFAS